MTLCWATGPSQANAPVCSVCALELENILEPVP